MLHLLFKVCYKHKKIKIPYLDWSFPILLRDFYLKHNLYFIKFLKNIQSYNAALIFIFYKLKTDNHLRNNP
jgi:hypothetical protein